MRKLTIVGMAALGLLLIPGTALAGGYWWSYIDLDKRTFSIGEEVTIRTPIDWGSLDEFRGARSGRIAFHAYLMPEFDPSLERRIQTANHYKPGWWEPQLRSIDLGELQFRGSDKNHARITFSVPNVASETYYMMLCTPGCERELGLTMPTPIDLVASPAHARAANRVDSLQQRLYSLRYESRREIRSLKRTLARERDRIGTFDEQLEAMNHNIQATTPPTPPDDGLPGAILLAVGALAGGLVTGAVRLRKGVRAPTPVAAP